MRAANSPGTSFLRELKRRNVARTGIYYVIICALALLVVAFVFPAVGIDNGQFSRILWTVIILGFPVACLCAWYFQMTPRGVVRTTSFVERRVLRNMEPINDRRHREPPEAREPADEASYRWILSAETGPLTGLNFGLAKTVQLGRALECDIAVVSPHVSPQHARLELEGNALFVEDLGSENGTVVNGKKVQGRQALTHEDELRLHDVIFRITEVSPTGNA